MDCKATREIECAKKLAKVKDTLAIVRGRSKRYNEACLG